MMVIWVQSMTKSNHTWLESTDHFKPSQLAADEKWDKTLLPKKKKELTHVLQCV